MSKSKKEKSNRKNICVNKKARFDYEILETYEAGIVLEGYEVKSLREGRASLGDAYARVEDGEVYLHNCHISPYTNASTHVRINPLRKRKLLLAKQEINRLTGKTVERGLTLIPLRIYFSGSWAKVELGLGRGRKTHDKRQVMIERTMKREAEKAIKDHGR